LGNSPDPVQLMEKYGADGVRVGMLLTSPAGNDLPFDEKLCEQGRNFANKIWNAFRLTQGWEVDADRDQVDSSAVAVEWMEGRIQEVLEELEGQFAEFRLSEALMSTYRLVWDDFCSWYLELIKPPYGEPIDNKTMEATVVIFEDLLKLLHPFMPFLTEEIWHWIRERATAQEAICMAMWPTKKDKNDQLLQEFIPFQQAVSEIRTIRKNNQIAQRESLELKIQRGKDYPQSLEAAMMKLTNLSSVERVQEKVPNAFGFVVGTTSFFIPFGAAVDVEVEKAKIQKEIDHLNGFLKAIRGKLSNERFVQNAPENVVTLERRKESDALAKLEVFQIKLIELG